MDGYDLTDTQKQLLRTLVECDDQGRLFEKGFLHILHGDDKYHLPGCGIKLDSLSDLEALCDAGLLKKEKSGPDPVYRITNAARTAVMRKFRMQPEVDRTALLEEIELQRGLMIAVATGRSQIDAVIGEYVQRRNMIRKGVTALGLQDPNPYPDLWDWYGKWSSGDLPTYDSRRQYIRELYAPLIETLTRETASIGAGPLREPTGWARVDRCVEKIDQALTSASNEEDFQAVGLLCRETLISLSQLVFNPDVHETLDGVKPSDTDAGRMLDAYIEKELGGKTNEAARRYAKASLSLANDLQHRRTADFRDAAMCAEATASVVNFVAIISNRRDSRKAM